MLIPERVLREMESYRRRVRDPARAARMAYAPVHRAVMRLTPRHFHLEGSCQSWAVALPLNELRDRLREFVVFSMDTALELAGLRAWTTESIVTGYVSSWECLQSLIAARVLLPLDGRPESVILSLCLPVDSPDEFVTASGFRITASKRLAEELLGRHGARLDLFARLVQEPFFSDTFP